MSAAKKIGTLVNEFATDVAQIIKSHVATVLEETAVRRAAPPRKAARPTGRLGGKPSPARRPGLRQKGEKRSPEALRALEEKLFAEIRREPGRRIEQIGARLRIPTSELALPIKHLLAKKKIAKRGQRRATVYRAAA